VARRRKLAEISARSERRLVVPRELVERIRVRDPASHAAACRQREGRDRWLLEHSVDPGDWQTVSLLLRASRSAHGLAPGSIALAAHRWRIRAPGDEMGGLD
jgi:hypothetical protein